MDWLRGLSARAVERFAARASAGLVVAVAAGVVFALLLALVRAAAPPLEALDGAVADGLNSRVAASKMTVNVLRVISDFGGRNALALVLLVGTVYLLIRRQPRLAVYLLVTAGGAFVLDPVVKLLVERVRPVVQVPVAAAPGHSFPSGHALDSLVAYGALLLVFLPTLRRRWRVAAFVPVGLMLILVGFARMALGVHYLSDVLAGWALGVLWLAVTAAAFRTWRREAGEPVPPVVDGLDPQAAEQITAAPAERGEPRRPHPARQFAGLVVAAVLVVGVLLGVGVLVTTVLADTPVGALDLDVVRWLADHRTPPLTSLSLIGSTLGAANVTTIGTLAASGLVLAVQRRWRPVLFLATVMAGEIILFLVIATVVGRARPQVRPLNPNLPPTSSFPSGHVAAVICLTLAITLLIWHTRSRALRWTALTAAVVLPTAVAVSRLYRGVHHPTDILGGVLLALLWVAAVWWIIRPGPDDPTTAPAAAHSSLKRLVGVLRAETGPHTS